MKKLASSFDIPVSDMTRAMSFYEHVTVTETHAYARWREQGNSVVRGRRILFLAPEDKPSHFGSRVYFNADSGVDDWLSRVEAAGGKTLVARTPIGSGHGFFALRTPKATALACTERAD